MPNTPHLHAVFVGQPKPLHDAHGTYTSSIARDPVTGPIAVTPRGLAGDRVQQPYHGSPDAALCAHLTDHYTFWHTHLGLTLPPGSVGENLTLTHLLESDVCVGDQVRLGTALVEVSGPRTPCATLARRIGRPDWVRLTLQHNRSGFYLRVLEPGTLQQGDPWSRLHRPHLTASIPAINACMFLHFDPDFAQSMLRMPSLAPYWKDMASQKLADTGHRSSSLTQ